ncbi:hypothetical protein C5167_039083 [Papaver somniferum]|uniref:Cation/H+ exchanger transmembrane domain-containing protein n=1 Tax=Papaver somniferum TaxID=3469 RepID=A0A4Y7IEK8_PAPSO|nr:hypothetical protein C5167_039083 [Papaver somniferum]
MELFGAGGVGGMGLISRYVNEADHAQVVSIVLFAAVLSLCIVVGHLLHENKWVNESITAIIIRPREIIPVMSCSDRRYLELDCIRVACFLCADMGIVVIVRGIIHFHSNFEERFEILSVTTVVPCVNAAGRFQVKKKQFFRNFSTIMLFGVPGVFISTVIITIGSMWLFPKIGFNELETQDFLAIGVIFSSTDTVCTLQVLDQDETPLLYSLVFGEGVVNDATSVVLFKAIQKIDVSRITGWASVNVIKDFLFLFSTSTALGVVVGLLTSYALRTLYFGRHSTDRECAIMFLMPYLSYMLAELLHLSGILTVFFCGIVMSHYAWHNVTENSRVTTRQVYNYSLHTFATMSFIAEAFIFLYCGMDASDVEKWKISNKSFKTCISMYSIIILLIAVGRAAFVFPLSVLSNYMNKSDERVSITFKHQVVIWWAGLMRGAVSIALAFKQFTYSGVTMIPAHATMVTNTVFGFLTKPLIRLLLPHHTSGNHHPDNTIPSHDMTLPLLSFDESASTNILRAKDSISMLLERPVYTIHSYWRKFDDKYMRPMFGGPRR